MAGDFKWNLFLKKGLEKTHFDSFIRTYIVISYTYLYVLTGIISIGFEH
jgi:hypothetical protein